MPICHQPASTWEEQTQTNREVDIFKLQISFLSDLTICLNVDSELSAFLKAKIFS